MSTTLLLHVVLFAQVAADPPSSAPSAVGDRYGELKSVVGPAGKNPPAKFKVPKAKQIGDAAEQPAAKGSAPVITTFDQSTDKQPSAEAKPAAGEEMASVHPPGTKPSAVQILREALAAPPEGAFAGREVSLAELLIAKELVGGRHQELAQQYWRLSAAVAAYHFALDQQQRLTTAFRRARPTDLAVVAALADAKARVASSRLDAQKAQHELAAMLGVADIAGEGSSPGAMLPLPSQRPWVGAYRTYFEEIFISRSSTSESKRRAKRIHDTLPLCLDAIRTWANAITATDALVAATDKLYDQGATDYVTLLKSHEQLRRQRASFVAAVLDYNLNIVEYAVLAAPQGATASDLIPMIIYAPAQTLASPAAPARQETGAVQPAGGTIVVDPNVQQPSSVVPAGGEQPLEEAAPSGPSTFKSIPAESQPAQPLRSVLVPNGDGL